MITHYQHLGKEIQEKEKERKKLNRKINKLLKDDTVHPAIAALSKQSHSKLIDIITLKDEQSKLPG